MKVFEADNLNGNTIRLMAESESEARAMIENGEIWPELRRTPCSRNHWERCRIRELKPKKRVLGVITY